MSIVMHAFVYKGAGESVPKSQVTRMPPEFVIINAMAMAVARLVWGAELLAIHVDPAGAEQ